MSETVLFVIDTLEVGGSEVSLLENVARCRVLRCVVCHLFKGSALKTRFEERGIRVYSGDVHTKYGFVRAFGVLRRVIKEERPGLIVACLTRSEMLARAAGRLYGIPVVGMLVSDLYSAQYNKGLPRKARIGVAVFRMLNRMTAGWCSGFIANSRVTKDAGISRLRIAADKIRVIPRGRDGSLFESAPRRIEGAVHFLNVGRLVPVKGQADLVRAFALHHADWPDDRLDIGGEGPCRDLLLSQIKVLGLESRVRLLGRIADVPRAMGAYDCLVAAPASEGFSGTIVEAMFAGLPVLASDIPAVREALQHLETGYLFAAGSVTRIAGAMAWFRGHRDLAGEMAASARNYARDHFQLEKVARDMEEYLQTKCRQE